MGEAKPTQWDETPCEHCGEPEGRHYVGRCNSVHSHKFYTPVSDSSLSYRQLVERVKELEGALASVTNVYAAMRTTLSEKYPQDGWSKETMTLDAARSALSKARPNTAEGEAKDDSGLKDAARESEYQRGYRQGYEQRDAEVRGALA